MDDRSTIRERTNWVFDASGQPMAEVHRVIEVATGLNFVGPDREYHESVESIEVLTNGTAAALRGSTKVYFGSSLTTAEPPITIVTRSNRLFSVRPVSVCYFDPQTGSTVTLATPNSSAVPQLYPPQPDRLQVGVRFPSAKGRPAADRYESGPGERPHHHA